MSNHMPPVPARAPLTMALVAALVLGACGSDGPDGTPPVCPELDPDASVQVAGTYRYVSHLFGLRGTLTFEQTGETVDVTETTYDNADDRSLVGQGTLDGNELAIQLVPANGDTDYTADVVFVFSLDGAFFCVTEFSDTNGDEGGFGSYSGTRQPSP